MNLTERDEYDIFNKVFRHCEFINQLTKQSTFLTKYQLCVGYKALNASNIVGSYFSIFQLILLIGGAKILLNEILCEQF